MMKKLIMDKVFDSSFAKIKTIEAENAALKKRVAELEERELLANSYIKVFNDMEIKLAAAERRIERAIYTYKNTPVSRCDHAMFDILTAPQPPQDERQEEEDEGD